MSNERSPVTQGGSGVMESSARSNEKRAPGCLGYLGDEILPSYIGIIS